MPSAFEVIRRAKRMVHILKLFGIIVINFLVICSSDYQDEEPNLLFISDDSYFIVYAVRDANLANSLWVNMEYIEKLYFDRELKPAYDEHHAPNRRYLNSLELSFNFPFYGYLTNYVTFDIDGRICMKKEINSSEACHSYVAPLATKMSFHKDESYLKYIDTGESLVVQWGNVDLYPPSGYVEQNVTVQVTLYQNGTIEFIYKQMLTSLFALLNDGVIKDLTIGTSDTSEYLTFPNFPYGVVALRDRISEDIDIKNGTVIIMSPEITCNMYTNCASCTLSKTDFMCAWCPKLNRCSNYGIDREYREWYNNDCNNHTIAIADAKKCFELVKT